MRAFVCVFVFTVADILIGRYHIKLEQVDGAPSHIPAPAPSHISVHNKIPNTSLQSSSIGLLPVTVSIKVLAQKA